jgi:hypothetical protein
MALSPRAGLPLALAAFAVLFACTVSIDHNLVNRDRGPADQPGLFEAAGDRAAETSDAPADRPITERSTTDRIVDNLPLDKRPPDKARDDLLHCTASTVLGCNATNTALVKCNSNGWGTTTVSCGSYQCSTTLMRCTGCDPATTTPGCSGSSRTYCSADGLMATQACTLGCSGAGVCCTDKDIDGYTAPCGGDCNDSNASVHPNQSGWFTAPVPIVGGFDYNCSGVPEKQYPDLVACVFVSGSTCTGEGWQGSVPACGQQGTFMSCKKQGVTCIEDTPSTVTQGCH